MKNLLLIGGLIVLSIGAFYFSLYEYGKYERCEKFITLAGNEEKTAYLYNWIDRNLKDEALLTSMGYSGRIDSSHVDVSRFRSLGIDWVLLDIDPYYASVSVIRLSQDRDNFTKSHNIKAVRFGEGRNSIILKLDPGFQTDSLVGGPNRNKIQVVSDRVSVYCD